MAETSTSLLILAALAGGAASSVRAADPLPS
jgi:hypothetical protein